MATETYTPDRLVAGDSDIVSDTAILLSGENRARGTLLGKITATGKLKLCNSANADGSQIPYAILADVCDASAADKTCAVYKAGEFNERSIIFGGADTVATHKEGLRDVGIYLKATVSA